MSLAKVSPLRRRMILAILVAIVFTVADAIGLWALNRTGADTPAIFNDRIPIGTHQPVGGIGPP